MTDELRELDAWIAQRLGWKETESGEWLRRAGENTVEVAYSLPPFTESPHYLKQVKREIERRGWIWQAAYSYEGGYDFAVHDPDGSVVHSLDGEETEVARILAVEHAETEELAGCLALKAAVEAET